MIIGDDLMNIALGKLFDQSPVHIMSPALAIDEEDYLHSPGVFWEMAAPLVDCLINYGDERKVCILVIVCAG